VATVIVRYWAAAKDAAGQDQEQISADTLADAIEAIRSGRAGNSRFFDVLKRSSILIEGIPMEEHTHKTVSLLDGAVIEVMPAFAGD
jgi:molybdopterin synthase sulfur carrier subunit